MKGEKLSPLPTIINYSHTYVHNLHVICESMMENQRQRVMGTRKDVPTEVVTRNTELKKNNKGERKTKKYKDTYEKEGRQKRR